VSKAKQRKDQVYYEGYHDGKKGRYFRWKRHPHFGLYRRGFKQGQKDGFIVGWEDL
jgi:hypothetical protein